MRIKHYLVRIIHNQFLSASIFSATSSSLKIITALIIGKFIAVKLGAAGLAVYGQLLNFVSITIILSGGAINDGVIKYVSQFKDNVSSLKKIFSTSIKYLFYCSLIVGILLILFSKTLSLSILHSNKYQLVFIFFGITIFFYGLNNFLLSILNGYKDFIKYNTINIIINIIGLVITIILIYFYGLMGALLGVFLSQSSFFIFTFYFLRNEKWFVIKNFREKFDYQTFKLLIEYAFFGLLTVAITPIVSLIIRNIIIDNLSIEDAGHFELVSRISSLTLVFFGLTVSTYYLPRISEIPSRDELFKEVKSTYKIIIPISFLLLLTIYLFRFPIILLLANHDFMTAENLFMYQLLGVLFRIIAQVSGFVFLAKAKIKIIIILEFIFNIFYILATIFFVKIYGLIGCSYAYLLYNFIYVIVVLLLFKRTFITQINLNKNGC